MATAVAIFMEVTEKTLDKTNHWYTLQKRVNKKNDKPAMDGFDHPFLGSHSG